MPLRQPFATHRRIAVVGLGEAGRGACHLLAALGRDVVALDANPDAQRGGLPDSVELHPGSHDPRGASLAVLSPGLNPEWPENRDRPALAPLWRAGIPLVGEIELAAAAHPAPLLSVGGTDGKSTTAALAHHLMRATGVDAALGGNSWTALSRVVLARPDAAALVAEVSAFQLFAPHGLRPRAAILTNIAPDHLDHYAGLDDYVEAKRHVLANLGAGDRFIANDADARLAGFATDLERRGVPTLRFDDARRPDAADAAWLDGDLLRVALDGRDLAVRRSALALPGPHNTRNALAALAGCLVLRGDETWPTEAALEQALASFEGLPHRLRRVAVVDGVTWVNDSKATNVHAAVTGLRAIDGPLVAIVGGVDKGLALEPLVEELRARARAVVVIGAIAERLAAELRGAGVRTVPAASMADAVAAAASEARAGDTVLLAPACSSFDMFRSFEHRGDVFEAAVAALSPP
jgi:UDP-N-acetylmuramoylalanine--D-glutamate ligase